MQLIKIKSQNVSWKLDTFKNSKHLYFNAKSKDSRLKSARQAWTGSRMRSFSQVSVSLGPSWWARNEFQEERQRVYNDGEVKQWAERAPKNKKRRKENRRCWSRQKLIWLRTFIAKSPGHKLRRGQKKIHIHPLFLHLEKKGLGKEDPTVIIRMKDQERYTYL